MSVPATRNDSHGDYLLVASGPIRKAPYLADWKAFKDHIRNVVKDQPGWTNVCPGSNPGQMQGWCRLRDSEDANAVYNAYSRHVGIHLFRTSLNSGYWDLFKCNCNRQFGVGDRGHSPGRSGIDVSQVNQTFGRGGAGFQTQFPVPAQPAQPVQPVQPAYQYFNYYPSQPYASAVYGYPAPPPPPVYSQSSGGLPVNLSQGAVITETRGIFIQGLNYSVGNNELAALLGAHGLRPTQVSVHKDSRGASKGVATASFSTKADAEYAVARLNGITHAGKLLTIRMDTNSTVVGSLEPFVVDGSRSRY